MRLNTSDLASGALFCLFGVMFLIPAVTGLDIGTTWQMGPGYFPTALALILIGLGTVICLQSLRTADKDEDRPFPWRAVMLVGVAPVLFAITVRPLGFVPAVAIVAFVGSFASPRMTVVKAIGATAVLTGMCVGIFILFLGLPLTYLGTLFGS